RKSWSSQSVATRPEDRLTWDRDAELSGEPLPVLDNGEHEELVYMVLSYVGGGDLFTMIAERHRYIGHDALVSDVFIQLLDAVAWCHERGVKHRDLKPENVLCDHDGERVVITDFGLATTERWSRDYGCGSSYYMSPECYGDPAAPSNQPNYDTLANDIWTLGVVLVNLATGRNPWEAASPSDPTFKSFCGDPSRFLMSILPITAEANSIFTRVFERDQARRCSLAELREMVLGVRRWTLRGSELDGASEGARDVARGCGLLDLEAGSGSSSGSSSSSDMAERSRFSEDTILEGDDELEDTTEEGVADWYDIVPEYANRMSTSVRTESACSHTSSLEMLRSRPVSKILSHSPRMDTPESWGHDNDLTVRRVGHNHVELAPAERSYPASESHPGSEEERSRPESIPRWPKMVQGWEAGEDDVMATPRTPPSSMVREEDTPRGESLFGTPRDVRVRGGPTVTPKQVTTPRTGAAIGALGDRGFARDGVLGATLSTPKSSGTPQGSPFQSRIPRYTGSPRIRTESARCAPAFTISPSPNASTGRERMQSAPLDLSSTSMHDLPLNVTSVRQMPLNASSSTLSVDSSSESSMFPLTPMKAEVILNSPNVIISRPSDGKLWEASSSSGRSLWNESCESQTTVWSGEAVVQGRRALELEAAQGRRALELEPGAPLFDPSARVFVGDVGRDRNRSWGAPVPSTVMANPAPRRRYHTTGEDETKLVFARRRCPSGSPPKQQQQRKVKRVPVPPIPNELLEEHERQLSVKASRHELVAHGQMVELLAADLGASSDMLPPPGLVFEGRDRQVGPKRLLENARAWFRRA
ncbi:hypothetical protein FRC09_006664, partial [Ceratobasidium sp. 395]